MERGGYNYVRTDCTLSFPAVSSSALSRILRGLYRYRADRCIGRLAGQKNRHYQPVWRKAGQHSGFAVLRRSVFRLFPVLWQTLPVSIWYVVAAIVLVRLASYATAAVRYHQFASLHTWLNKLTGVGVFLLPYVFALSTGIVYCWMVCVLALAAALEELAIHLCRKTIFKERE